MGRPQGQGEGQGEPSDADRPPGPRSTTRGVIAWWGRSIGSSAQPKSGHWRAALLAFGGLGVAAWLLAFTYPGDSIADVANLNVTIDAPSGSVEAANASVELHLTSDGGATVALEVYFVCQTTATMTIEFSSREALRVDYSPESPGPRLGGSLLSAPSVRRVDDGIQVSGSCGQNDPVNIPFSVEFPADTVAVPLERGRYAFGMDVFVGNLSNVLAKNSHSIGVVTPDGALLTDAFNAQTRTFNRATWEGESEFGLSAYGTYTEPAQVARARWWENVALLLLGAMVGIVVEAALRRLRPQRDR